MKRSFVVLVFALLAVPAAAMGEFLEGVEYVRLKNPVPVETGKKIEVREFFWYGCPHCYALEPSLEQWVKKLPKNVEYIRTPAVFNERWAVHARAYYAFQMLGLTERLHGALFHAIHAEKKQLFDVASLATFVAEHGGDRKAFLDAYNSFGMQQYISRAEELQRAYAIDSVPTLFVDGRFMTNANIAGGVDKVTQVLDVLIRKAAAARAGKP